MAGNEISDWTSFDWRNGYHGFTESPTYCQRTEKVVSRLLGVTCAFNNGKFFPCKGQGSQKTTKL